MYTVRLYEGRLGKVCEVDLRYREEVARFLKIIKWNDSMEIFIDYEGDLKYYIKYEEELELAITIFEN